MLRLSGKRLGIAGAVVFLSVLFGHANKAAAFFIDGSGHYSLVGQTETSPGLSGDRGLYQAINQNFRLLGEARLNERASVFLEFRLFDNPRAAYFGDQGRPRDCNPGYRQTGTHTELDENGRPVNVKDYEVDKDCGGRHQNSGEPGYEPYVPKVTQVYARYAFDYCLLDVGRRGRDWGMGIFLSSGKGIFDTDSSVFDGVTCNINIQKTQTLGFSVGFDKLAETGENLDNPLHQSRAPTESEIENYNKTKSGNFGPTNRSDDLEQYFFTIEYDDRKANAGAAFTKNIGVYFANVMGDNIPDTGQNTDIKFLDLYTGFYMQDLAIQNEILFRLGKSVDPNWVRYGGKAIAADDLSANKLQSIAFAGNLDYTLARSGSFIGPADYNRGDASRHALTLDYAYAPGDAEGYKDPEDRSSHNVKAVAFHRNYKPALILFNGHPELDEMRVDGAFDPSRVLNATLLGFGYRYESLSIGNFDVKFFTAQLDQAMPEEEKAKYVDAESRPVGYAGKTLGYELDIKYSRAIGRELELGLAGGAVLPGKAWQTRKESAASNDFLLQSFVAFKF